jgi:predicted helicase
MTFNDILEKYRRVSTSERDKGDRFERLVLAYLQTDPLYKYQFTEVWMWKDFPGRRDLGSVDTGIDLVAKTYEGSYWAIQCKCYQETAIIDKAQVDKFLSTSSRSFKIDGQTLSFSNRLWVSTTNKWSTHANEAFKNQQPPVQRINLDALQQAPIDWEKLENGIVGSEAAFKKKLLPHQTVALEQAKGYYASNDRGKLIMACGTGKTFTSLRIAEALTNGKGRILYLVPSIALLGQTLREWAADAQEPINAICICSDPKITKKRQYYDETNDSTIDLAVPASTDISDIIGQFDRIEKTNRPGMTVVFSTYQSIDVIARTQEELHKDFDLIVCDEAHRTTGVVLSDDDKSSFVRVHDNSYIRAKKRLYMTATPRLYGEVAKAKAAENDVELCSMDDSSLYGEEIYRIGFGEAVERDLLTDYKVLILTLNEDDVPSNMQSLLANQEHEIDANDLSKIIGSINALSKQVLGDNGLINATDPNPMRRSVAFCQSIAASKTITGAYNTVAEEYVKTQPKLKREKLVDVYAEHIDGTMSAPERDDKMGWLKAETGDPRISRILTNVRCLSEGVDVPSLDAVMFLSARNSQVDVVQSVGRVMRKSEGKKYGYIIIPIVIPSDVEPEDALNDNDRYRVVWTVLNALRAHDDRFNATVNKIDLNKNRPDQVIVGQPDPTGEGEETKTKDKEEVKQTKFNFETLQNAIYARMVLKVGDRRYWEQWATSVADIAERQIKRITKIVDEDDEAHIAMRAFIRGLRKNINPSVTEQQAIEMLSQHIITKPVFEALFEGYSFVQNNAVSVSMQKALDAIEAQAIEEIDAELLDGFYKSVRKRAEGIDNAEGKQRIIVELYDKFFKTAFPKLVEQLGIVYTPIEVVDFIINSVNDVLQKEFNSSLSDENVNILDPFTGTGTFITRLIQSGTIKSKDLERKYKHEIFANEIVLLAYYIAAVNIENAYHDLLEKNEYDSFEGIVLTDTFQLSEDDNNAKLFSEALAENSERLQRQQKAPLRVIIGNPPYSVGQRSANDNAQNQKYPKLESRIEKTYAKGSKANSVKALYDSYVKAFRWASDRLSHEGGVVSFVSNGSWIEGGGMDGFRKALDKEFSSIYVFNLRGNQRTSGELSRREGGKIFGSGSRTPISITVLVRNPVNTSDKANIYYHDIGDYLDRNQKLAIVRDFRSISNEAIKWQKLTPNEHGDWINLRNDIFEEYIPLASDKKFNIKSASGFITHSLGVASGRDSWVYNYSVENLLTNMGRTIDFYNDQRKKYSGARDFDKKISYDPTKISWNDSLKALCKNGYETRLDKNAVRTGLYRPFSKSNLYFDKDFIQRPYQQPKIFPSSDSENLVIAVSGIGATKPFSVLMSDKIVGLDTLEKTQCFPLYYYEVANDTPTLFDRSIDEKYVRHDGISDYVLARVHTHYHDKDISKEDIFYYAYGLLHSPDYRQEFANDLRKMLPRLPLVIELDSFWEFTNAGRKLAELHLNYENVDAYPRVKISGTQLGNYHLEKLKFIKKDQRDTIIYNQQIKIEDIPEIAYEYIVNGKSAIEWIMDRYQIRKDKSTGIVNDPNDWAKEVSNRRYILDLLLSVINVSVQTVEITNALPKINFTN